MKIQYSIKVCKRKIGFSADIKKTNFIERSINITVSPYSIHAGMGDFHRRLVADVAVTVIHVSAILTVNRDKKCEISLAVSSKDRKYRADRTRKIPRSLRLHMISHELLGFSSKRNTDVQNNRTKSHKLGITNRTMQETF